MYPASFTFDGKWVNQFIIITEIFFYYSSKGKQEQILLLHHYGTLVYMPLLYVYIM